MVVAGLSRGITAVDQRLWVRSRQRHDLVTGWLVGAAVCSGGGLVSRIRTVCQQATFSSKPQILGPVQVDIGAQ
jgi:hypothetical protein